MQDLEGKVAVVTGGASGIGKGLAQAFVEAGMNVVLADVDVDLAQQTAGELERTGVKAIAVKTDVTDPSSMESLAATAYDAFGEVHVLCNNAGVLIMAGIKDLAPSDWEWLFGVNVLGVVNGIHAFLPRLLAQEGPAHIVNTGSVASLGGGGIYGASKSAVLAISESLSNELAADGIGVTVLMPANISSRINSAQRNRPDRFGRKVAEPFAEIVDFGLDPVLVGRRTVQAIRDNELFVCTFPAGWEGHFRPGLEARMEQLLAAVDRGALDA